LLSDTGGRTLNILPIEQKERLLPNPVLPSHAYPKGITYRASHAPFPFPSHRDQHLQKIQNRTIFQDQIFHVCGAKKDSFITSSIFLTKVFSSSGFPSRAARALNAKGSSSSVLYASRFPEGE
jgi:hypothetical protein